MDPLDAVILLTSCQNSRLFFITIDDYTISTTSEIEPYFIVLYIEQAHMEYRTGQLFSGRSCAGKRSEFLLSSLSRDNMKIR